MWLGELQIPHYRDKDSSSCTISYSQIWRSSHFLFRTVFSGPVDKNKSLEALANNAVWGVHWSQQLPFENCHCCWKLPILQSGGHIESIKSEDLWGISSEGCWTTVIICQHGSWLPNSCETRAESRPPPSGSLHLPAAFTSPPGSSAFSLGRPCWSSSSCVSPSLTPAPLWDARTMPCCVKRLWLSVPPHQQEGSWKKYHKWLLLLWQRAAAQKKVEESAFHLLITFLHLPLPLPIIRPLSNHLS